jgi:hypothetical protein
VSLNPRGRRDFFVIDFMWAGGELGYNRNDDRYRDERDYRRNRDYRDEGYRSRSSDYGANGYGSSGNYAGGSGLMFSGRIDGRVRVIVQGERYWVQNMSGRPASEVRVDFGSPLPARPMNVELNRVQGRDEIRIIEQPSAQNGYRLVFEINDDSGGDDFYQVQARW